MKQKTLRFNMILFFIFCLLIPKSESVQVYPGMGVTFHQLDIVLSQVSELNSRYGLLEVNPRLLTSSTSLTRGYLNVYSSTGWSVRNIPIDTFFSIEDTLGIIFNLGDFGITTSILAFVDFSEYMVPNFTNGPVSLFQVTPRLLNNIEGDPDCLVTSIPPPGDLSSLRFDTVATRPIRKLVLYKTIEQKVNQCAPASMANSLNYLRVAKDLPIPVEHQHIEGDGTTPDCLVGKICLEATWTPTATAGPEPLLRGKLNYLDKYCPSASPFMQLKHKEAPGYNIFNGTYQSYRGKFSSSENTGPISITDWIIREFEHCEDVEMDIADTNNSGAHMFMLSRIEFSRDVITFFGHDDEQGKPGGRRLGIYQYDVHTGQFKGFAGTWVIRYAFSESYRPDTPYAVTLSAFTSNTRQNTAYLSWITSEESNNFGFDIERRTLNGLWSFCDFLPGKGNSNVLTVYQYVDRLLPTGQYEYRLKQIDFNGNFEYFDLPEAVTIGVPDKFFVDQNYPDPFNPKTTIAYGIPQSGNVTLKIFDMAGREIKTLVNEFRDAGYYVAKFDGSSLASGTYIYRIESGSFVSAKKMLLLK